MRDLFRNKTNIKIDGLVIKLWVVVEDVNRGNKMFEYFCKKKKLQFPLFTRLKAKIYNKLEGNGFNCRKTVE